MIERRPQRLDAAVCAFTMVELLVVVTVIALLISILIGVGVAVMQNAQARTTQQTLATLDRALEEYMVALNTTEPPPHRPANYDRVPGPDGPNGREEGLVSATPIIEFEPGQGDQPERPDASVFLRQIRGVGEADAIIASIPDRFLVITAMPPSDAVEPIDRDSTPSVVDAWADEAWVTQRQGPAREWWPIAEQSLIYYVHPDNRRPDSAEKPDAQDLYGQTVNNRPYFMSAGADGFYGHWTEFEAIQRRYEVRRRDGESELEFVSRVFNRAREDNLYSYEVDVSFDVNETILGLVN